MFLNHQRPGKQHKHQDGIGYRYGQYFHTAYDKAELKTILPAIARVGICVLSETIFSF